MIAGIFHQGSGIGNQLHRYVATRVLAADKGYEWGMVYNPDGSGKEEGFKGQDFMPLDWGLLPKDLFNDWNEKKLVVDGVDIRSYDPEFNFVEDNTIIDGEFQDPRYFEHRMDEIDQWLKVEPLYMRPDTCVIGFRGGEYAAFPDLYLTEEYWDNAIVSMRFLSQRHENLRFEVHTDDLERARSILGKKLPVSTPFVHDPGINWRSMRYAKYAIIANSSFYILPRLLAHHGDNCVTIAPRYWARRNTKVWALPQNYYKQFLHI